MTGFHGQIRPSVVLLCNLLYLIQSHRLLLVVSLMGSRTMVLILVLRGLIDLMPDVFPFLMRGYSEYCKSISPLQ